MTARVTRAEVTEAPLDPATMVAEVADERCGAVATFCGVVRNHDHGVGVSLLDYTAHPSAGEVIARVAEAHAGHDGVHAIAVSHRVGPMAVGDVALVAVVAAEHRGEAFATLADLVDAVKAELPVWKRQELVGGGHEWVGLPS